MRLAERRGVLQGRSLSQVQARAVEMLLLIDNRERAREFVDTLRIGLVASDPSRMQDVFPEWVSPEAVVEQARRPDGTYDVDELDRIIPASPAPAAEEIDDIDAWIASRTGTATAGDLLKVEGDVNQWH